MDTKFVTSFLLYLFANFHVIIPRISVLTATKPKTKNNFPYSRHVFTFPEIIILLTSEFFIYIFLSWSMVTGVIFSCQVHASVILLVLIVGRWKHGVGVSSSGVYLCQNTLKLLKINTHTHTLMECRSQTLTSSLFFRKQSSLKASLRPVCSRICSF